MLKKTTKLAKFAACVGTAANTAAKVSVSSTRQPQGSAVLDGVTQLACLTDCVPCSPERA